MVFCAQCGTELPPEGKFCGKCGNPVSQPPTQPVAEEVPPQYEAATQRIACVRCGCVVPSGTGQCGRCGSGMPQVSVLADGAVSVMTGPATGVTTESNDTACSRCGAVYFGNRVGPCVRCGAGFAQVVVGSGVTVSRGGAVLQQERKQQGTGEAAQWLACKRCGFVNPGTHLRCERCTTHLPQLMIDQGGRVVGVTAGDPEASARVAQQAQRMMGGLFGGMMQPQQQQAPLQQQGFPFGQGGGLFGGGASATRKESAVGTSRDTSLGGMFGAMKGKGETSVKKGFKYYLSKEHTLMSIFMIEKDDWYTQKYRGIAYASVMLFHFFLTSIFASTLIMVSEAEKSTNEAMEDAGFENDGGQAEKTYDNVTIGLKIMQIIFVALFGAMYTRAARALTVLAAFPTIMPNVRSMGMKIFLFSSFVQFLVGVITCASMVGSAFGGVILSWFWSQLLGAVKEVGIVYFKFRKKLKKEDGGEQVSDQIKEPLLGEEENEEAPKVEGIQE